MKNVFVMLFAIVLSLTFSCIASGDLVITGVIDGDLPGGRPKAIVLQATADIADLTIYGVGSANNGGGSDGEEFRFSSGSASAGDFMAIGAGGNTVSFFNTYFGDVAMFQDSVANINGDDAIELFQSGLVIDTYGDIDVDGSATSWDYTNGYAVRTGGLAGGFIQGNYSSNDGALSGLSEVDTASALDAAFGFFSVPEPGVALVLTAFGLVALRRKQN